jgi:hypothetical protein
MPSHFAKRANAVIKVVALMLLGLGIASRGVGAYSFKTFAVVIVSLSSVSLAASGAVAFLAILDHRSGPKALTIGALMVVACGVAVETIHLFELIPLLRDRTIDWKPYSAPQLPSGLGISVFTSLLATLVLVGGKTERVFSPRASLRALGAGGWSLALSVLLVLGIIAAACWVFVLYLYLSMSAGSLDGPAMLHVVSSTVLGLAAVVAGVAVLMTGFLEPRLPQAVIRAGRGSSC